MGPGIMATMAAVFALAFVSSEAEARRDSFTAEQRAAMQKIDRILVEALALTDRGEVDVKPIAELTIRRLHDLGYTAFTDASQPHDVVLRIKCEQRKVWEGTIRSGGDADLPDSPSRTWKGPACQLRYLLNGKAMTWAKEVRADYLDAIQAAAAAGQDDPGAFALATLRQRLEDYDFPVFLASEWAQEARLLKKLEDPGLPPTRKIQIIRALGEMFADGAGPALQRHLKDADPQVAAAAAIALGNIGHQGSVAALIDGLQHGSPELRLAAARGLGKVGALHGDASIIPPLIEALNTDDIALKTEVVWALGQLPDRRAYEPLVALQRSLRDVRTSDRQSPEGKLWDAVNYSIKQLDGFDQLN